MDGKILGPDARQNQGDRCNRKGGKPEGAMKQASDETKVEGGRRERYSGDHEKQQET